MNFLELGDFRSKWVGESERILSKVLELIKSYSPVIVFIDELDQSEGSRGTSSNSDVDKRTFSKLLQFMSDTENRGKVLWIGASNRPDLIDAALKRPGRFDLKIPFLPQNADERKETFARYLFDEKIPELSSNISDIEWEEIKKSTDGYTGAEIEEIVNSCIRKKIMEDNTSTIQILGSNLIEAITEFNPGIKSKVFQDMVDVSLADITSIDLIPIEWRGDWKKRFNIQGEAI
ncbi:MAG: ATP-binding protein [Bacteroidales bacterium]|nr:ATP-binding protein [Bacteroidales bacterium]